MKDNPFNLEKPEERKIRLQKEAEVKANLDKILKSAKTCLASDLFQRYKADYIKGRDVILKMLNENINPNPVEDAHFIRAALAKLSILEDLLKEVEKDAKREVA